MLDMIEAERMEKLALDPLSLKSIDFAKAAALFAGVLILLCVLAQLVFGVKRQRDAKKTPEQDAAEKKGLRRLSWALSCFNSGLLTLLGCVYTYFKFKETGITLQYKSLHNSDDMSFLVCLWFGLFNATDLVFGSLMYPAQMDFLTAYIHHPLFIYIMIACTTGYYGVWMENGKLVPTLVPAFAPSFMLMTVEELPTFILALGSVFPSLRSDLGFGISFFLLRIVYHGYVMMRGIQVGVHTFTSCLFGLTMVMHIFWFRGWVVSYLNPKKKDKKL
jgi:hypothetical protein